MTVTQAELDALYESLVRLLLSAHERKQAVEVEPADMSETAA